MDDFISLQQEDFFKAPKPTSGKLHLLFNPPYGERLNAEAALYQQIGDTLKNQYPDTDAWLISSNPEAIKSVGLRPSRKIKVFNGGLEARLLHYAIYKGSKKQKYQPNIK